MTGVAGKVPHIQLSWGGVRYVKSLHLYWTFRNWAALLEIQMGKSALSIPWGPMRETDISPSYVPFRQTMLTAVTEAREAIRAQGKEIQSGRGIYSH